MTLRGVPAFTRIAIVGLGVQAEAQTPCPELVRLRNALFDHIQQISSNVEIIGGLVVLAHPTTGRLRASIASARSA